MLGSEIIEHAIYEVDQILEMLNEQKIVCDLAVVLRLRDLQRYLKDGK